MAKFHLPKLNSWVTTLVLASIGLHGLVLALPMPSLVEQPPEVTEVPDPEVIQVVTLPKLVTAPESLEPPLPEIEEEPPPEKEPEEVLDEELVLVDPDVLDEVLPEPEEELTSVEPTTSLPGETLPDTDPNQTELDKQLEKRESYSTLNNEKTGADFREGGSNFSGALVGWMGKKAVSNPDIFLTDHLEPIEAVLQPVNSLSCLKDASGVEQPPSDFVSIAVEVSSTDGSLVLNPDSPYALNSSGYEILDKKALEIAKDADYSPYYDPNNPAPGYWFNVQVDYDFC